MFLGMVILVKKLNLLINVINIIWNVERERWKSQKATAIPSLFFHEFFLLDVLVGRQRKLSSPCARVFYNSEIIVHDV